MIFDDIKTEKDLEKLKSKVMRDEKLHATIMDIRKGMVSKHGPEKRFFKDGVVMAVFWMF